MHFPHTSPCRNPTSQCSIRVRHQMSQPAQTCLPEAQEELNVQFRLLLRGPTSTTKPEYSGGK